MSLAIVPPPYILLLLHKAKRNKTKQKMRVETPHFKYNRKSIDQPIRKPAGEKRAFLLHTK